MENCFIQKIKSAVNNNNLCTLDGLLLVVPKNTNNFVVITSTAVEGHYLTFTLKGDPSSVYFCSNSSYNDNLGQTKESANNLYIKNESNEDAFLLVSDRYRIRHLFDWTHQDNVRFAQIFEDGYFLSELPSLTYLYYSNGYIESQNLKGCAALKELNLDYHKVNINLDDIKDISTLETFSVNASNIRGDISLLSSLKKLKNLVITYCTGTSGTLESLFEGLSVNRATSSNLDCFVYSNNPNIMFNSVATLSGKHYIVTFTPNDTKKISVSVDNVEIAYYNGSIWTYNS